MGLFDFLKGPDIAVGLEGYRTTPGAVLMDVAAAEGKYK